MRQRSTFSDDRLDGVCSYCGGIPDTKDHVPSKVLLDDPFPENLPKVPCCNSCNQSFSLDEEYIACFIECVLHGTTDINKLSRQKIKRILSEKESLRVRIEKAKTTDGDNIFFQVEEQRLKNVILKLARGHAKFENSEPQLDAPTSYSIRPIPTLTDQELEVFLETGELQKFPEVGSRAMQNLILGDQSARSNWTTVQRPNYIYNVTFALNQFIVKIIIWDYLVAEVVW